MGLTAKQKKAADYFIAYGNKEEALRVAGYSKYNKNFFENQNVADYIKSKTDKGDVATIEEIMAYLTRVVKGVEVEKDNVTVKTGKDTTDIKLIEKPISVTLKLKAAEMLIKLLSGNEATDILPVIINDDLNVVENSGSKCQ